MSSTKYRWALVVLIVFLVGAGGYMLGRNGIFASEKVPIENSEPVFHRTGQDNFAGPLELRGYRDVKPAACDPSGEIGPTCDGPSQYVFFVIQETNAPDIFDFINEHEGNAFVSSHSIGLGCLDDQRIYSQNKGDDGVVENVINGEAFQKLLASSQNNPVTLKLSKPELRGGGDASQCYSHFRNFTVL